MLRKPRSNVYWTKETDQAILEYNKTHDKELFLEKIYPAFVRLAEANLKNHNIYYYEGTKAELQNEVVTDLYEKMPLFKEGKGSGFGYFNLIARNHCYGTANDVYKMLNRHKELNVDMPIPNDEEESAEERVEACLEFMTKVQKLIEARRQDDNLVAVFKEISYLLEHAEEINPRLINDKNFIYAYLRGKLGIKVQTLNNTMFALNKLLSKNHVSL